jgi:hypothetical protein
MSLILIRLMQFVTRELEGDGRGPFSSRHNMLLSVRGTKSDRRFGNNFYGLPVRRCFGTYFNRLSVRRNLSQLV